MKKETKEETKRMKLYKKERRKRKIWINFPNEQNIWNKSSNKKKIWINENSERNKVRKKKRFNINIKENIKEFLKKEKIWERTERNIWKKIYNKGNKTWRNIAKERKKRKWIVTKL